MQTTYAQKNETIQKASANTAESVVDSSSQSATLQRHASLANAAVQRAENPPRPNNTGLPDDLKNGIESLSGYSLDNVRVHYNSPKPATVQALAYTQGTDIHVAPGQEHALPHEAWHVTQQMAGRVSPTTNINGMPVNDNAALEHEADVMGEKAVQCKSLPNGESKRVCCGTMSVQRYVKKGDYTFSKAKDDERNIAVKENEASTIYIKKGAPIPDDLKKLGIENKGEITLGDYGVYQICKQGRIASIKKIGVDGTLSEQEQEELHGEDVETMKKLLYYQKIFVEILKKKCTDLRECLGNRGGEELLKYLIQLLKSNTELKCLGGDIYDALYAMLGIAKKIKKDSMDAQALLVIEDDLNLRLSQIQNEENLAMYKPFFRTMCTASAYDRGGLIDNVRDKTEAGKSIFDQIKYGKGFIEGTIKKGDFPLGWDGHRATRINQDISVDDLYVEDAVGKSANGYERANAHWFAHIYGVGEDRLYGVDKSYEILANYPLNSWFLLENHFNKVEKCDKNCFKDFRGKSWNITCDKLQDVILTLELNEDMMFYGMFFTNRGDFQYNDDLNGIMDFMLQTANSAIDGMFVGELAKKNTPDSCIPSSIIMKDLESGDVNDRSLLSIYKANHPS